MNKVKVKTLRQWTEPNGTTHEPDEIAEIDPDVPGMDFEEHLLAQGVVEVVSEPTRPAFTVTSKRSKPEVTEPTETAPESEEV